MSQPTNSDVTALAYPATAPTGTPTPPRAAPTTGGGALVSTNEEPSIATTEIPVQGRSAKVDLPQQYRNWRDYAFSEFPEDNDSREQ